MTDDAEQKSALDEAFEDLDATLTELDELAQLVIEQLPNMGGSHEADMAFFVLREWLVEHGYIEK